MCSDPFHGRPRSDSTTASTQNRSASSSSSSSGADIHSLRHAILGNDGIDTFFKPQKPEASIQDRKSQPGETPSVPHATSHSAHQQYDQHRQGMTPDIGELRNAILGNDGIDALFKSPQTETTQDNHYQSGISDLKLDHSLLAIASAKRPRPPDIGELRSAILGNDGIGMLWRPSSLQGQQQTADRTDDSTPFQGDYNLPTCSPHIPHSMRDIALGSGYKPTMASAKNTARTNCGDDTHTANALDLDAKTPIPFISEQDRADEEDTTFPAAARVNIQTTTEACNDQHPLTVTSFSDSANAETSCGGVLTWPDAADTIPYAVGTAATATRTASLPSGPTPTSSTNIEAFVEHPNAEHRAVNVMVTPFSSTDAPTLNFEDFPNSTICGGKQYPPLKALNPYNFFFREERERILNNGHRTDNGSNESRRHKLLWDHWGRDRSKKRSHRKSHGMISFQELSKQVSARWRSLSESEKKFYRDLSAIDHQRFKRETDMPAKGGKGYADARCDE